MIVPNKLISYRESIIYKMIIIIDYDNLKKINILDLYNKLKNKYSGIDEFIYSIEVLYILEYIDVDFVTGEINYVKRNKK